MRARHHEGALLVACDPHALQDAFRAAYCVDDEEQERCPGGSHGCGGATSLQAALLCVKCRFDGGGWPEVSLDGEMVEVAVWCMLGGA